MFLMSAGVAEAIIRKSALKFSEHISANTPKFNAKCISAFSNKLFVLCVSWHLKHFPVYFSAHEMKSAECD